MSEESNVFLENKSRRLEGPNERLTLDRIESISTSELRAIGFQRGYELPDVGGGSLRRAFLKAQNVDLGDDEGADLEGDDEDNEV